MSSAPRLAARFARARAEKRAALIVYLTADDPDGATSLRLMRAAAEAGADVIEIGIPWSDPSADGKAIQAAMHRALARGGGLRRALGLCSELRAACPDVGLVLFGYANPILVMGVDVFALKARDAGADGLLCVDYPPDEDRALPTALAREGLDFVPLLAPTSTDARIDLALAAAGSFVYYVSMTGTTGTALADLEGPRAKVAAIRERGGGKISRRRRVRHPHPRGRARRRQLRRRGRRRQRRRGDRRSGRRREARSGPRDERLRPIAAPGGRRQRVIRPKSREFSAWGEFPLRVIVAARRGPP